MGHLRRRRPLEPDFCRQHRVARPLQARRRPRPCGRGTWPTALRLPSTMDCQRWRVRLQPVVREAEGGPDHGVRQRRAHVGRQLHIQLRKETAGRFLRDLNNGQYLAPASVFCSRELEIGVNAFVENSIRNWKIPSDDELRIRAREILGILPMSPSCSRASSPCTCSGGGHKRRVPVPRGSPQPEAQLRPAELHGRRGHAGVVRPADGHCGPRHGFIGRAGALLRV